MSAAFGRAALAAGARMGLAARGRVERAAVDLAPPGVEVDVVDEGMLVRGRGLRARWARGEVGLIAFVEGVRAGVRA